MYDNVFTKLGKGPNLLFLHGWGQDRHTWDGVVGQLKDEFTCWTVDLPGFGQNPRPKDTWNPHNYAEWVSEFIKDNDIDAPTVIGHSFGGRVAIELAARSHPVREGVGDTAQFISGSHEIPGQARNDRNKQLDHSSFVLYAAPGFREPISRFTSMAQALARGLKHARISVDKIPGIAQVKKRLQSADDQNANAMRDIFRATIEHDLAPAMSKIDAPVLLLWGEHDKEVPLVIARAMKETIPNSELKIIPAGSHFAHLENPTLFRGMIRSFAKHHGQ